MDAAFLQSLLPADSGVRITDLAIVSSNVVVGMATIGDSALSQKSGQMEALTTEG